nr:hypothetical protein [Tanacetum cinerariifolium]
MDTRKNIVDMEAFREMLHISPRVPGQSFAELPFEEEILKFLWNTKAYMEYYACATGEAAPKPKASARRKRGGSDSSTTPPTSVASPRPITTVAAAPRLAAADKGKQPARATSPTEPSEHGGFSTDEGTSSKPGVPDVPSDDSDEEISWNSSDEEDVDDQTKGRDDNEGEKTDESDADDDDQDETKKDDDDNNEDDEEEIAKLDEQKDTESGEGDAEETGSDGESEEEETREEEEKSFDLFPRTPEDDEDDGNGDENQGLRISEEERIQEEEEADELYRDVDINQGRRLQVSQDIEDSYVTLTPVQPDGVESIFTTASSPIAPLPTPTPIMTPFTIATMTTTSEAPIPPTTFLSAVLENLPTFDSIFRFEDRVKEFETDRLQDSFQKENDEFLRTIDENMKKIIKGQVKSQVKEQVLRILPRIEESVNAQLEAEVLTRSFNSSRTSYAVAADLTEIKQKKILIEKMEGNKSIQRSDEQQNLYKALVDAYEADKTILESYGDTAILKRRRGDNDDQEGPSAGLDRGSKRRREEEPVQTTCQMDEPPHSMFETGVEDQPIVQTSQHPEWFSQPRKLPTPDRGWNKTLPVIQGSAQTCISELAKQDDSRSSFNELLDTPIDFSNFIMNRLCVDTLTPELLAGPTYELTRGSCTSLTELEYHLEEVYKETTDQLDWINPEGQQYPHNLLQPLPLIPDNRGRRVILFAHFINNDLEYLWGGASSRKYTTYVTKTKAADYGHIKWIEDLVPRTMWIHEPLNYDTHALWGVSHWGRKLESYQKRLNLTKPDTYRSNLKRREAYTTYSNPRGFIYQNKDKKNRLMRIDELHKFSDETLNDVRNALDDRLKGIRMNYLPQAIWRKCDKDRAAAMIQSIDKMLKTRMIMRSLERFVGRRLYEGDFQMLQRTI